MVASQTASVPIANRLLAALSAKDFDRLRHDLEPVELPFKYEFAVPGGQAEHVYFPFRGVMSMLVRLSGKESVEVALVGSEGMVGISSYLGSPKTFFHIICQVPGNGVRMKVNAFQKEVDRGGALATALKLFFEGLLIQMTVAGACNHLHTIEQRCARWMLMTHDRVDGTEFILTQEFLAKMLGIRRAGVNGAAASLKQKGFIGYKRGIISVVSRDGLETSACECYKTIKLGYERHYS